MAADRRSRLPGRGAILLGLGLLAAGCALPAAGSEADLVLARWRLQTPLGEAGGPLLAAVSKVRGWRLEVGVQAAAGDTVVPDLGRRLGEGWTLCAGNDGAFRKPWHEPWRTLDPRTADALADLLAAWLAGPPRGRPQAVRAGRRWRPAPDPPRRSIVLPDAQRILSDRDPGHGAAGPGPDGRGALRRRLVARGLGRGGDDLLIRLRWDQGRLVLTTNRWPLRLTIAAAASDTVSLPEEAYLPLWPLAEFLP